jgi:hypothetical protein
MEKYEGRKDVQFITFNIDENPGLVEPAMRELKISLITIPAYSFVRDTLKVMGIPQNWIVDDSGTIRAKAYDAPEGDFEAAMREGIEKYKPEARGR